MNRGFTVDHPFHVRRGRRSRKELREGQPTLVSHGRIPRVARLLALAIRFDQLIRDGMVADFAEIARLGHVTRARLTQIAKLLNLAPDLQEQILFLPPGESGRDPITERELRPIVAIADWRKQRRLWRTVRGR